MQIETKFVYFDLYCPKCKNQTVVDTEDPCDECLTVPVNFEEKIK